MGQPRLRIAGRVLPLSQLVEEWDKEPGRLVIIGDPGYGKTVAALTLVAHINQTERTSGVVAELFTLADWSRWARDHPDGELEGWLADELAATYGGLGVKVARALVESGRILPLLDGLDEVPEHLRQRCRDSIEVYAGRATSRRPFVVTSRVAEYAAMAPNLVNADREAVLVGFSKEQALEALQSRTTTVPGWDAVRRSFEGDNAVLARLFRSPLRLSVALQAYETGGAEELLQDTYEGANRRMWDRVLSLNAPQWGRANSDQIRRWLERFAAGMRSNGRQRLWLHELYLYVPNQNFEFRRVQGAMSILAVLAVSAVYLAIGDGSKACWVLVTGTTSTVLMYLSLRYVAITVSMVRHQMEARRSGAAPPSWRESRLRGVASLAPGWPNGLAGVMGGGLGGKPAGVVVYWTAGAVGGGLVGTLLGLHAKGPGGILTGLAVGALGCSLIGLLVGLTLYRLENGRSVSAGVPGRGLTVAHPLSVLRMCARAGLATGVIAAVVSTAVAYYGLDTLYGPDIASTLAVPGGIVFAVFCASEAGLGALVYFHFLRTRSGLRGDAPWRVNAFLQWCSQPERSWLRGSNAFEFRHREFLDHLSPD